MIQDDIRNQQDLKLAAYLNQVWEGVLPKNFIEMFKQAIYHVPFGAHSLHVGTIRDICSTDKEKLTIRQVGICQDIIRNCPPYLIFEDFNLAMHKHGQIEGVAEKFKRELGEKQRELDNERRGKTALLNQTSNGGLRKI